MSTFSIPEPSLKAILRTAAERSRFKSVVPERGLRGALVRAFKEKDIAYYVEDNEQMCIRAEGDATERGGLVCFLSLAQLFTPPFNIPRNAMPYRDREDLSSPSAS